MPKLLLLRITYIFTDFHLMKGRVTFFRHDTDVPCTWYTSICKVFDHFSKRQFAILLDKFLNVIVPYILRKNLYESGTFALMYVFQEWRWTINFEKMTFNTQDNLPTVRWWRNVLLQRQSILQWQNMTNLLVIFVKC